MNNNKNIIFNHTLEQYNKKYRNRRHRLLKYTKKQVEDFDKEYGRYIFDNKIRSLNFEKFILKNRKWWLINDTYYEIPKPIRFTWFRNLNIAIQTASCIVGAGILATSIAVPILKHQASIIVKQPFNDFVIDIADISGTGTIEGQKVVITMTCKDVETEIKGIVKVKVGEEELEANDYSFEKESQKLTISKQIIEKHSGKVSITPIKGRKDTPAVEHTISFKVGDQVVETKKVVDGTKVGRPSTTPSTPGGIFKAWFNNTNEFDFKTQVTSDLTLIAKFSFEGSKDITECEWNDITTACDSFETGGMTEQAFCATFNDGTKKFTSLGDFIGAERKIYLSQYRYEYTVRIIGVNHDTLDSDDTKKAVFTFEFENLLSDNAGNTSTDYYFTNEYYTEEGISGSVNAIIDDFQDGVKDHVKKVKKQCCNNIVKSYNAFLLSATEMNAASEAQYPNEGTTYAYWANHSTSAFRKKHSIKKEPLQYYTYWTRSTKKDKSNYAVTVTPQGEFGYGAKQDQGYGRAKNGMAPAFCI